MWLLRELLQLPFLLLQVAEEAVRDVVAQVALVDLCIKDLAMLLLEIHIL